MRRVLVVLVVVAACGGGGKKSPTITNEAPPKAESWTMARALAALPPDTALVLRLDVEPLRRSPVVGSYIEDIQDEMVRTFTGACAALKGIDVELLVAVSGGREALTITAWMLDTPTVNLRNCLEQSQAQPPGGVAIKVDGDFATITPTDGAPQHGGVLILDDHTAVMMFGKRPQFDRSDLMGATATRNDALKAPELDQLVAGNAPIWGFGAGASGVFAELPTRFRTAAVDVKLADKMAIDARVRLIDADQAAALASSVTQQSLMMKGMGFVDELTATAEVDALLVHVVLGKSSIDKMLGMMGGMFGGGGTQGPVPPPPPPKP